MSPASSSGAGGRGDFAAQLDWLLRSIPRYPGSSARFELEDLVSVLSAAGQGGSRPAARSRARSWLRTAGLEGVMDATPVSQRYVAILEDLFRLPEGYFRDESIRQATNERITFALDAAARGVTVIGPCRVRTSMTDIAALHSLHVRARQALDRRTGS